MMSIQHLAHVFAGAAGYVVPFFLILFLVVLVHELGHYVVGRWCGIRVMAFSMGFGPELLSRVDGRGTRWRLAAIPLGGYVKFFGDRSGASTPDDQLLQAMTPQERAVSFQHQPVWKRAATVAAGPAANILFAVALLATVFLVHGRDIIIPRIESVLPGSAAERAGLQPGDVVLSIDGSPIESFVDLQRIVTAAPGVQLTLLIERNGRTLPIDITPELKTIHTSFGDQSVGLLGIQASNTPADRRTARLGPLQAVGMGLSETWFVISRTASYAAGLVTGRETPDQLSGPIRMAQVSGEVAESGLAALLRLAAVISVSIGLINLAPVPLLDGGHLLFYAIEALRGRSLSLRTQELGFRIGLGIVAILVLFTTVNDVIHVARY